MTGDSLDGYSAGERARIEAMLDHEGAEDEDGFAPSEPVGAIRRTVRWLIWLTSLAMLALTGWHVAALALLPDTALDGVHAPIALTIGFTLFGIVLLLWFDGRWRWLPLLALAIGAFGVAGLSMRWVDSSKTGVHEYWAGLERGSAVLPGDLCYRIDAATFALRRRNGRAGFTYRRGIWPSTFSEAEFKRYFFSDLPMRAGTDGWTCVARPA